MTINVAVKCADGIVMGADSLMTLTTADKSTITSIIPYYSKLFPIRDYSAGAMVNGSGSVAGITVEDIIQDFDDEYKTIQKPDDYDMVTMANTLGQKIQQIINDNNKDNKDVPRMEIIIAGYSKIKNSNKNVNKRRSGEIYSLQWDGKPNSYKLKIMINSDTEFGTCYGGQPTMLDRFRYGIDDWVLYEMLENREWVFGEVKSFIFDELKKKGIDIPVNIGEELKLPSDDLTKFNVFKLISPEYVIHESVGLTLKSIKENTVSCLQTMEKFFSLQVAINYCSFLMSCAFAQNAFTMVVPTVGSEMRVASITRDEGFKFRRIWEIQTPGPPFR
jgi:hypothetical protein